MTDAIREAKIEVSWTAGHRTCTRTLHVKTTERISNVRVRIVYRIEGVREAVIPVKLDDGALAAFLSETLNP